VEAGEIRTLTALLVSSLVHGDAGTAARTYANDALLLTPTARLIHGQAEIEGYWRAGIALGLSSVEFENRVLEAVGASIVEVGRYAVSMSPDLADAAVDRGTYVVLHAQDPDGSWRRAVDVFNPDASSPARRTDDKEESR
jgi:ketosteroid isomerase-like protein